MCGRRNDKHIIDGAKFCLSLKKSARARTCTCVFKSRCNIKSLRSHVISFDNNYIRTLILHFSAQVTDLVLKLTLFFVLAVKSNFHHLLG